MHNEVEINEMYDEFMAFKDQYRREAAIREIVDKMNVNTDFKKGWRPFVDRYGKLVRFLGGLASVFPGTSTVESDFSVIGIEKDCYRNSLTDFELEGVLQSKQYMRR
jgi:hypothetical protein